MTTKTARTMTAAFLAEITVAQNAGCARGLTGVRGRLRVAGLPLDAHMSVLSALEGAERAIGA